MTIEFRPALRQRIGRKAVAFYCHDCGRRFYNKGWHAEACGSSNYQPVEEKK